jgi:hypothetical protein
MGFFGRLSNLGKGIVRTRFGAGSDDPELAALDAELAAQARPVVNPRPEVKPLPRPAASSKGPGPAEPTESDDGGPPVMKRTL